MIGAATIEDSLCLCKEAMNLFCKIDHTTDFGV